MREDVATDARARHGGDEPQTAARTRHPQRGRQFERNLDILVRLWTEERVTLEGDEFNLREAVMVPRTAQRPRPPILIGGYVDAVLRRAATIGDAPRAQSFLGEASEGGVEAPSD